MSDASKILPGGRGPHLGPDAQVNQDEAYDVRRRLEPLRDGWLISTVGENIYTHLDVTAVAFSANELAFYYIPDRVRRVLLREARLNVASAVASATMRSAIYIYDNRETQRRLVKLPGSESIFDCSSTGLKRVQLSRDIELPIEAKCFIGSWASSASIAVEGYQSGAGAAPRVIRQRAIAGVVPPLGNSYRFADIPVSSGAGDTPLIAYLSPDAVEVF